MQICPDRHLGILELLCILSPIPAPGPERSIAHISAGSSFAGNYGLCGENRSKGGEKDGGGRLVKASANANEFHRGTCLQLGHADATPKTAKGMNGLWKPKRHSNAVPEKCQVNAVKKTHKTPSGGGWMGYLEDG